MSQRAHTVIRLVALAVLVAVAFMPRSEQAPGGPGAGELSAAGAQ